MNDTKNTKNSLKTNNKYNEPMDVNDIMLAFPARVIGTYLPLRDEIPDEFKSGNTKWNKQWNKLHHHWFFSGLEGVDITPKPGIDMAKALRHLAACQMSFEPKHEHKSEGVAYLMSLWFEDVTFPEPE